MRIFYIIRSYLSPKYRAIRQLRNEARFKMFACNVDIDIQEKAIAQFNERKMEKEAEQTMQSLVRDEAMSRTAKARMQILDDILSGKRELKDK